MKWYIPVALLFVGIASASNEVCHDNVVVACSATGMKDSVSCNSLLGGFEHAHRDLQSYVNTQLATSYDYLLLGTHFNSYQKNRPGFEKLFKELSEKAWDNAVGLIKHITNRGGSADFNNKQEKPSTVSRKQVKLEMDEFHALALVLDSEKKLATEAHLLHKRVSHLEGHERYDPEIAQYLEEEFIEDQSKTVRKLSGYVNDLAKLVKVNDPSLSIYLFDEYLQKQK